MAKQLISELIKISNDSPQLVDRSNVIDHLLDIRSSANGCPDLLGRIDRILAQVPGVTVVSLLWWRSTLSDLEQLANLEALV